MEAYGCAALPSEVAVQADGAVDVADAWATGEKLVQPMPPALPTATPSEILVLGRWCGRGLSGHWLVGDACGSSGRCGWGGEGEGTVGSGASPPTRAGIVGSRRPGRGGAGRADEHAAVAGLTVAALWQ